MERSSDGDLAWQIRFGLLRLKGLVLMNRFDEAADLLLKLEKNQLTPEAICQRTAILGIADLRSHRKALGEERLARAVRISGNLGLGALTSEISSGF